MSRVKNLATGKRRKKVLKQAKGYWGRKSKLYKTANETVLRALQYAYRDRKVNKRNFRSLWITRINAACHTRNISYSKFIAGIKKANITLNRKILAYIAMEDPESFNSIVEEAHPEKLPSPSHEGDQETTPGGALRSHPDADQETTPGGAPRSPSGDGSGCISGCRSRDHPEKLPRIDQETTPGGALRSHPKAE